MEYKVLKNFKCRFQDLKIFKTDEVYESVDEKHTEKLVDLGFIEKDSKSKRASKKKDDKS